ncbi:MAG: hypothetical protein IIZ47_07220 [Erysipelotrichaceae bacterium]|nr:hypothetical protein [Erysipelotrichaceae bacterium]
MIHTRLSYHSEHLGRQTSVTILFPEEKNENGYPYVILLHPEHGDDTLIARMTSLERYGEGGGLAFVMPDGGTGAYLEAPYYPYEEILGKELREKLEHFCRVSKRSEDRCLGGFGSGMKAAREIFERHPEDYAGLLELPEKENTWEAYDASLKETLEKRFRTNGTVSEDRI